MEWTNILSIIGAAAWIPIIFIPLIDRFRKVKATLLDSIVLTNGSANPMYKSEIQIGTILILVFNLYVNKITFFAKKISVNVVLKNGSKLKGELLTFSTLTCHLENGRISHFNIPVEEDVGISRTIHGNEDNIKYLAFIVDKGAFSSMEDIKEINIYLSQSFSIFSKRIKIDNKDFPIFQSPNLFKRYEEIKNEIQLQNPTVPN